MTTQCFNIPIKELFKRHSTEEIFTIESLDNNSIINEQDIEQITKVCNEELIYKICFKDKFLHHHKTYSIDDAKNFIKYAKEGWKNNDIFTFIIRNPMNQIVGALDIKSSNLLTSEIGYWLSCNATGVMTNAVLILLNIAKESGYKSLYALTILNNTKSQNVLLRTGFNNEGIINHAGKEYIKFTKIL